MTAEQIMLTKKLRDPVSACRKPGCRGRSRRPWLRFLLHDLGDERVSSRRHEVLVGRLAPVGTPLAMITSLVIPARMTPSLDCQRVHLRNR